MKVQLKLLPNTPAYCSVPTNARSCQPTRRLKRTLGWAILYVIAFLITASVAFAVLAFSETSVSDFDNTVGTSSLEPKSTILSKTLLTKYDNLTVDLITLEEPEEPSVMEEMRPSGIPEWRWKKPIPKWPRDANSSNSKLILLWTPYFADKQWTSLLNANGGPVIYRNDRKESCFLTTDRKLQDEANSLVFHGRDTDPEKDLPKDRRSSQHWVWYLLEAPINSKLNEDAKLSDYWIQLLPKFNISMTYHSKLAQVHMPMIQFNEKTGANETEIEERVQNFATSFQRRKYDALWIVSNCITQSKREHIVDQLRVLYGLSVNIVGKCNSNEKSWAEILQPEFISNHRFYFAFENSLCDEYMTEKAFNAFNMSRHYGLIPVMVGAGEKAYNRLLPTDSFVNVDAFGELFDLGNHLHRLGRSKPHELFKFWQWLFKYDLDEEDHVVRGFRGLCDKLWGIETPSKVLNHLGENKFTEKLKSFRNSMGKCAISNWFGNYGPLRWNN